MIMPCNSVVFPFSSDYRSDVRLTLDQWLYQNKLCNQRAVTCTLYTCKCIYHLAAFQPVCSRGSDTCILIYALVLHNQKWKGRSGASTEYSLQNNLDIWTCLAFSPCTREYHPVSSYILPGQFHADKIHVEELVQQEMLRLRTKAKLKLCYTPLADITSNCIVASFNAQSLNKHIDDIKNDWNLKAASVLGICETRLKEGEDMCRYQMEDFVFYHMEQSVSFNQRPYHGVALYVRSQFHSEWRFSICTTKFECIAVDICNTSTESKMLIIMCYKQPGTSNERLFTELQEMIQQVDDTESLIIMGDFNVNQQEHGTIVAKMSKILQCRQIITDVTTKSNTCIDLIFTNMDPTARGSIFTSVSHHHLTYAAFDRPTRPKFIWYYQTL